jgi:hypothetical protein
MDNFLAYPHEQRPPSEPNTELQIVAKFRRALRREEQEVLDDLLHMAVKNWPLQSLANHITPLEFLFLTMLLEQEKQIERLKLQISKATGSPVHPPFP